MHVPTLFLAVASLGTTAFALDPHTHDHYQSNRPSLLSKRNCFKEQDACWVIHDSNNGYKDFKKCWKEMCKEDKEAEKKEKEANGGKKAKHHKHFKDHRTEEDDEEDPEDRYDWS